MLEWIGNALQLRSQCDWFFHRTPSTNFIGWHCMVFLVEILRKYLIGSLTYSYFSRRVTTLRLETVPWWELCVVICKEFPETTSNSNGVCPCMSRLWSPPKKKQSGCWQNWSCGNGVNYVEPRSPWSIFPTAVLWYLVNSLVRTVFVGNSGYDPS